MISIIGFSMAILSLVALKFLNFNMYLMLVIGGIGCVLVLLSLIFPRTPKYKNRELLYEYELLPIVENMYLLELSNGKIICKFINGNNEIRVETVDSYWKEINEFETGTKACIKYYERKSKFTFTSIPFMGSRIEVDINIPKGTIIS